MDCFPKLIYSWNDQWRLSEAGDHLKQNCEQEWSSPGLPGTSRWTGRSFSPSGWSAWWRCPSCWSRWSGCSARTSKPGKKVFCIVSLLPALFRPVFQSLISVQNSFLIGAWQPSGLNYWSQLANLTEWRSNHSEGWASRVITNGGEKWTLVEFQWMELFVC